MPNQTDIILQDIESERLRRENLTVKELKEAYNNLIEKDFPDRDRIKFIADLGDSREIAYHYELICKDWEDGSKLNLSSSFDKHGREGLLFLLEELYKTQDEKQKIYTAYLLAVSLSKMKHREFYEDFCDRLSPELVSLLATKESNLRQKVIISFGFVGSVKEVDILTKQLLKDEDALCRAYSASSLMQMSFHRVDKEIICKKTKNVFSQAIEKEKDLYACGIMIEAAQILFGKRWISSSAVENIELEKIEKAR